jgi:multiple sugar transport system substrate-binding protein
MKNVKLTKLLFVFSLCFLLILSACTNSSSNTGGQSEGNQDSDGKGKEESVEISVLSWRYDPESEEWKKVVSAFNEEFPNIKVKGIMAPSGEIVQKVTSMIAGGQPVDVLFTDSTRNNLFASKGLLEDIEPYLENSDINLEEDYYVKSLNDHKYKGKLYGLPILNMSYFMYYNKDLLDAAGVEYPTNDWTIDEFLTKAQKLTNLDKNQYGYNLRPWVGTHFLGWSFANEGEYFTKDGKESLVNSKENVETMQFLKDLIYKHKVAPIPKADAASQAGGVAFESGNLAMNWSGSWDIKGTELNPSKWNFKWGVVMPPKGPNGSFPIVISNAWGISSKSKNKDAAWKFVNWFMGDEAQKLLAEYGEFPSKKSIAQEFAFTHLDEETRKTVFMTTEEGVARPTEYEAMPRSEAVFGAKMEAILSSKDSDLEKLMDDAKIELDQLMKDIEAGK